MADPKSVVAVGHRSGRLQEGVREPRRRGRRQPASSPTLDRRNRADYLSAIARLEARLGRTQEALKAGRELLAAAPGNVERHQEFAELCFNLGEVDEGLDALRRASRANPSDPKASNTLADALARQFRTEEAIELYWRAFDRTKDLDGRLAVVSRLAEQYLQRNQFDRLIARLERELREPERKRELTLCLAQAYQAAGDLGTARQELESLLSANPRDSGPAHPARQPGRGRGGRRGRLALPQARRSRSPRRPRGRPAWATSTSGPARSPRPRPSGPGSPRPTRTPAGPSPAIDSLLAAGKYDTVLTLTERLLLKRPDDWDALYREGVALINLDKPAEAARRFEKILELKANDDDLAAIPKSRKRGGPTGPTGVQSARTAAVYQFPVYMRRIAVTQIRSVTKLETQRVVILRRPTVWTPADFGQARMAALAWLYAASLKENDPEAWAEGPPGRGREARGRRPGALGPRTTSS